MLCNDLLSHIARSNSVDFTIGMTPTEETAVELRKHIPEAFLYNAFNAGKVETMLNMQRDLCKSQKQRGICLFLDDCMYDKRVLGSVAMRDLFMNGRHLHITFVNAMQYIMDMGPDLRTQVDYVFALKENIMSNKMKLWRFMFGMFGKFEDFSCVMDRCTQDYGAIVLDNTVPTNDLTQCIFWYKAATDVPPYRLCKPMYWSVAERIQKTQAQVAEAARARELERRVASKASGAHKNRITSIERQDETGKSVDGEEMLLLID